MSAQLLAEFHDGPALLSALDQAEREGHAVLDAFTPYPVEGIVERLSGTRSPVRPAMLAGGIAMAGLAYGLQVYSAVWAYPFNSGGRPLHSWPVFLLVPFEVGIFAAALCGVVAFFKVCGLPRLHHPVFDCPGFERASQDRYFLLARADGRDERAHHLRALLEKSGGVVTELRPP